MIAMALHPAIADTSTALKVSSALPGDSPPTDVIRAVAIVSLVVRSYAFFPATSIKLLGALLIIGICEFEPFHYEAAHRGVMVR
jgi:hypothetical protein